MSSLTAPVRRRPQCLVARSNVGGTWDWFVAHAAGPQASLKREGEKENYCIFFCALLSNPFPPTKKREKVLNGDCTKEFDHLLLYFLVFANSSRFVRVLQTFWTIASVA